jgi:hypothetical protein
MNQSCRVFIRPKRDNLAIWKITRATCMPAPQQTPQVSRTCGSDHFYHRHQPLGETFQGHQKGSRHHLPHCLFREGKSSKLVEQYSFLRSMGFWMVYIKVMLNNLYIYDTIIHAEGFIDLYKYIHAQFSFKHSFLQCEVTSSRLQD